MLRNSILFVLCAVTFGCNDNKTTQTQRTAQSTAVSAQPPANVAPPPTASAAPAVKVELQIASVGDTMTYDKAELTAPAKSEVHLVLKNNAKLDVLPHNWVLVHEKTEAKVAADGLAAGKEKNYLPENSDDVLAAAPLAPPGQTSEVTFTAPKYPGKYPYICTVPGHYLMMKGVLNVTASQ